MGSSYISVATAASAEHIVKKSRFITNVFPVQSEEDMLWALGSVREAHPSASHVCFAFKYGLDTEVIRFSDAGEPGGTAGRPILEVIEREGLRNTLVTVTRYFGGILLGAAGLVRAYSASAAAGVAAAGKATYVLHQDYSVTVDYSHWGRVERLLAETGARIRDVGYGVRVSLCLQVPATHADAILGYLRDATSGQAEAHPEGEEYFSVLQ